MTFGEKLQKLRAREGLSQDALAELLNVSRQAVSRWERDETMPETEKVVRISDYFHVTTDYLLKDAPEQPPPCSSPSSDPPEVWRKYGFCLAWAVALWGFTICLRMLPGALIGFTGGADDWLFSIQIFLLWISPGASVAAAGVLWARRWQRARCFRRQDLGWALALGGGWMLSAYLLTALMDRLRPLRDSFSSDYAVLCPALLLALGFLLALLPSRKRREKKSE